MAEYLEAGADGLNIAFRPPIDWDAFEAYIERVPRCFTSLPKCCALITPPVWRGTSCPSPSRRGTLAPRYNPRRQALNIGANIAWTVSQIRSR